MFDFLRQWLRARKIRVNAIDSGPQDTTDYAQDREDNRLAHMSEEDRAWEAASLQKDRETPARTQ